jgi:hypothetical protein
VAYDPEMGGDTAPLLHAFNGAFGGHVRNDAVCAESYEPNALGQGCRACVTILLYPNDPPGQQGRCTIVDLLHLSEAKTPRCGNPECRCMRKERASC